MRSFLLLIVHSWLARSCLSQSITQFNTSATSSPPITTVPAVLTPCGTEPPSCYIYQALEGIILYAYANYTYTQTVASLTYKVTKYRDTTITNTITVLPATTQVLPEPESLCDVIPGGCGDAYHRVYYSNETTTVYSGTTLTSGHVYMEIGLLSVRNTGYKGVDDGGKTICKTDNSLDLSDATSLPPFTKLIDIGPTFNIQRELFPAEFVSDIRNDPVYTNQYPEVLTCSIGGGRGAPVYQVLVTQLTATTTDVQSLDLNYNQAAPVTSIPALAAVTSVATTPPQEISSSVANPSQGNDNPSSAGKPGQPLNSPNSSPSIVYVPTTIISPGAAPITSLVPVLFSHTTSINAIGSSIVTSVPVQDGTTTLINIPITTLNAAGNPITTFSSVTAIIASGSTYLAPTTPPSGLVNPSAVPGSPGGPASVITFSGTGIPSVITIGSTVVTADSSSEFVIGGQTLTPGGAITVSSSVISLAATGTGRAAGSLVVSVLGGQTATATGSGASGTGSSGPKASVVMVNQGVRSGFDVGIMIKITIVGVFTLIAL